MPWPATPSAAFGLLQRALGGAAGGAVVTDDPEVRALLEARDVDGLLYLVGGRPGPMAALQLDVWMLQLAALDELVAALRPRGVTPVVFKGAELIPRHFPDTPLGFLVDVDVLVPRHQLQVVKQALYGLGYTQSYFDVERFELVPRDIAEMGQLEATHYELGPFCRTAELDLGAEDLALAAAHDAHPLYARGGRCLAVVEVDVHHSVATDVDPAPLLDRAVPSTTCDALTLSASDHLWLNCSRFYNEAALFGKRTLRPLAYTAPLLARETIDWPLIAGVARELELTASLHYPLRTLQALTGAEVPDSVLEATDPRRGSRDFGWMLGPLFGVVEPFPVDVRVPLA